MQETDSPRKISLPIDPILPDIRDAVKCGSKQLILRASPGTGKTTRVPPALLDILKGQIWILEPRRLAAKMSALRVRSEMPDSPHTVGWQMRDDTSVSSETRLLFLTEGMFPVRLAHNPRLDDVSCIILDEFHERHAQTDVAYALALELQRTVRPDLVIIVMSATLDVTRLLSGMPEAKVIDIDAPVFPVETKWWRGHPRAPLPEKVLDGVKAVLDCHSYGGHILVFLPGARDIEKSGDLLRRNFSSAVASGKIDILELRATLSRRDQERVFEETTARKIILATNIAESSLTIPGVTGVVDAGLARVPMFYAWNQMPTLETRPVSQASLIQRAGRAGRTAPGVVLRLFSEQDYAGRPPIDTPEILRTDLSTLLMSLCHIRLSLQANWEVAKLPWLDSPPEVAWQRAEDLLKSLGILSAAGILLKPETAALPLHPRIARFLDSCIEQDQGVEGVWLAAILSDEQNVLDTPPGSDALGCDLLARYDLIYRDNRDQRFSAVTRLAQQLTHLAKISSRPLKTVDQLDLATPLLAAYPDRVAKARRPFQINTPREYTLCGGGDAVLLASSAASHSDWIVAWSMGAVRSTGSATDRSQQKAGGVTIDGATGFELTSLERFDSPWLTRNVETIWDEATAKVRSMERRTYGTLLLSERRVAMTRDAASKLVEKKLTEMWPKPFAHDEELQAFVTRQALLKDLKLSDHVWDADELKSLVISIMADGAEGFSDITEKSLSNWLRECVGETEWQEVESFAPAQIKVGAGFMIPVHYDPGKPPWIEARLQNFFGQMETPKIAQGRMPLTVHLLAPNQRALQVTTDLANFWKSTYPSLRNEYMRKYPRHVWPENPLEAEPPVRGSLKPRR